MIEIIVTAAAVSLATWIYLLAFRGGFWRAEPRLEAPRTEPEAWPAVVAVIPARDEVAVIGEALGSVLSQDYPGDFHVIVIDDHSRDGTGNLAQRSAEELGQGQHLTLLQSRPLPAGWSGKLWALAQGIEAADREIPEARYLWLTDADIAHDPDNLRRLVAKAETGHLDLVSLMVMLSCRSLWERLLIPPFVFFFQKLYPFAWSNAPASRLAAAAGGCILVSREALRETGDLAPIKDALIDDCALARQIKADAVGKGRGTWIGLGESAHSVRPYQGLGDIWHMVARTAYHQLRYSAILLVGTLLGMVLTYLVPPAVVLGYPWHGSAVVLVLGLAAWALMALAAGPTFRLYGQAWWHGLLLPVAALLYALMTFDSALNHWRGRGGAWKGRVRTSQGRSTAEADRA